MISCFSRKKLDDFLIDKSARKGRRKRIKLFQERGETSRDGVVEPHRTLPAGIARFPAAMGFGPGCRDVRIGPSRAARADYDRPVRLAAWSHVRSTPEHEAPISAQNVCETRADKSSCRARFHDHF
jgi:hypothetical protein